MVYSQITPYYVRTEILHYTVFNVKITVKTVTLYGYSEVMSERNMNINLKFNVRITTELCYILIITVKYKRNHSRNL